MQSLCVGGYRDYTRVITLSKHRLYDLWDVATLVEDQNSEMLFMLQYINMIGEEVVFHFEKSDFLHWHRILFMFCGFFQCENTSNWLWKLFRLVVLGSFFSLLSRLVAQQWRTYEQLIIYNNTINGIIKNVVAFSLFKYHWNMS